MSEFTEFSPAPGIVDALRGKISEPIQTTSYKPGSEGQLVTVRLALEGPCMFGLTDPEDNKEWYGIFNHSVLSARYATYFAQKAFSAGVSVDPQLVLDGMIVSHPGRRQWDEALWYPKAISNAAEKTAITNETLGLRLIKGNVGDEIFFFVASLAYSEEFPVDPAIYTSWEHRLAILADHRTSNRYLPLHIRMGDFIWSNFFDKSKFKADTRELVHEKLGDLFIKQRRYRLGTIGGKMITADEISDCLQAIGANLNSSRSTLRLQIENLLEDLETEVELIKLGIDPENINDETVPQPKWEDDLSTQYLQAASLNL